MFSLRRFCWKRVAERWCNLRFESSRGKVAEPESKDDNKNPKDSTTKASCKEYDGGASQKRCNIKVGIIGGGMAPIYAALLLKQSRLINTVNIADPKDTLADAVYDLNQIDTSTRIKYYGKQCIAEALIDVDIIALMDETDFKMGKSGPVDQFTVTSSYVCAMSEHMVHTNPSALVAVFARPVTATLPMVSEVYKCAGCWDPDRIIGSTAIDAMRIAAMTATLFDLDPTYLSVPIVGGADPCTVVPLFNQARPINQFSPDHENMLIHQLRAADKELACSVESFEGPSLSSGTAASKFIVTLASGLYGHPNVISSAYVRSNVLPICRFFSNELHFGESGVQVNLGLPKVSPIAINLIEQAIPHINELSDMAINIVRNKNKSKIKV